MAYVTTLGAGTVVARPSIIVATPAQQAVKKVAPVTGKTPAPLPMIRTLIGQPNKSSQSGQSGQPGAVIAPDGTVTLPGDSTRTLLIAGGALTVGLLLIIALRR